MKRRGLYCLLVVMIAVTAVLYFHNTLEPQSVRQGSKECVKSEGWTSAIVADVNSREIHLQVGGKEVASGHNAYMDDNMNLMISSSVLTDAFYCAANFYDREMLVLEKNARRIELTVGDHVMKRDEKEVHLAAAPVLIGEELFIPVEAVSKGLGYSYTWSMAENTAVMANENDEKEVLPYRYDYREIGKVPKVKNQGALGTCWAFASLNALETSLLPEYNLDLSEDRMSLNSDFNVDQHKGGDYTMSIAYLAAWRGPVLEEDDPYGDGESPAGLSAVKHVQEIQMIGNKDYQGIKRAVYLHGGVQTSIYTPLKNYKSRSKYYNNDTNAYCYIGEQKANHDIVIIGWDDSYPKENFNMELEGDGAFICLNSWGEEFGDNGIFYISYYDTNIGIHNLVYTRVEETDNYSNIYQSDLCGWVGQMGYGNDSAYFANVYQTKGEELLRSVAFYATGPDTEYEVYVVRDAADKYSFYKRQLVASGNLKLAGYYTVELEESIPLDAGERFAVIVYITTPGSVHPIAIEYMVDESTETVDLSDGEGYISANGSQWTSAESTQQSNICLKAFTDDVSD